MSVLIKMAMPQNCRECRLMEIVNRHGSERYICIAHLNEITNLKERLDTCPLEEAQETKRGEWELVDEAEPRRYGCSECKRMSYTLSNYCSYCGARMS